MDKTWSKIQQLDNGCWLWTGTINDRGYGEKNWKNKTIPTHRFVYEQLKGKIPFGLQLDHLCRNRACVNPLHLEPVTRRVNIMRGEGITAKNVRKTHCPAGHPFTGENVWLRWYNKRQAWRRECRACRRLAHKRWKIKVGYKWTASPKKSFVLSPSPKE